MNTSSRLALEVVLLACATGHLNASGGQWIRPAAPDGALTWGRTDGIVFGIPSPGGMPGPRGLIRVGIVNKTSGRPELINFIAIEPVAAGPGARFTRMAFSELEPSALDRGQTGKRLWVDTQDGGNAMQTAAGELSTTAARAGVEQLTVRIEVERFSSNGADVYIIARMDSHCPNEIRFSVHHNRTSAPIEELTLTATMGNYERLRHLWLKDRVIDSRVLYAGYQGDAFTEWEDYSINQILKTAEGDAVALCTPTDETPAAVEVANPSWRYRSGRLTQYWLVPARHIQPSLRVRMNGRRVYWASTLEIPGGIAFENFEFRQRYVPGQEFIFGLTPATPQEMRPKIPRLGALPDVSTSGTRR